MENNGILEMQRTMNALRQNAEQLRKELEEERASRRKEINDVKLACMRELVFEQRENAELRAVILYLLDRARADYAVIKKKPFERLSDAVYVGEINFETAENLSGDYVIRVPATDAVIGGMAGVMHGRKV